jgi:hypothetical protein
MHLNSSEIENQRHHLLLALLGLSGIVLLFFDFTDGDGVVEGWDWFGRFMLPVVIFPFMISAGYFARLSIGKLPQGSNLAGFVAAILVSAIALYDFSMWDGWDDLLFLSAFTAIPAVCIYLGIVFGLADDSSEKGLIAVQTTYATHVSFYLSLATLDLNADGNIGYWLAWLVFVVGFIQIALLLRRKSRVVLFVLPAAAMWILYLVP